MRGLDPPLFGKNPAWPGALPFAPGAWSSPRIAGQGVACVYSAVMVFGFQTTRNAQHPRALADGHACFRVHIGMSRNRQLRMLLN